MWIHGDVGRERAGLGRGVYIEGGCVGRVCEALQCAECEAEQVQFDGHVAGNCVWCILSLL